MKCSWVVGVCKDLSCGVWMRRTHSPSWDGASWPITHTLCTSAPVRGRSVYCCGHSVCVWEWVSCVLACAKRVHVKERDRKSLWVCVRHREARERHFGSVKQAFKTLFISWTHKKLFTWNTPEFLNGVNILINTTKFTAIITHTLVTTSKQQLDNLSNHQLPMSNWIIYIN